MEELKPLSETELEIIKLKWRVSMLQHTLVKFCAVYFSFLAHKPPQEFLQEILDQFDLTIAEYEPMLLSAAVPEARRALLADEFAQVVEEMKTSVRSMPSTLTDSSPKR